MWRRPLALAVAFAPAVVVAVFACGTLESTAPADGGVDAGPPCDITAKFGPFVPLNELNDLTGSTSSSTPRLTPDELHIYFESTSDGSADIWTADRPTLSAAFGGLRKVPGVASSLNEFGATVSEDQRDIFFTRADGGPQDVLYATRSDPSAAFGVATDVFSVPETTIDDPFLLEHPRELWFTLRDLTDDAGRAKLHRASSVDDAGAFAAPTLVATNLDATRHDRFPVVSADRTEVFVSSETDKLAATLYQARRVGAQLELAPVDELAGPYAMYAGWISPDHCRLYLTRSRDDTGKAFDIGYASRQRP